jgi:hypothetical protein
MIVAGCCYLPSVVRQNRHRTAAELHQSFDKAGVYSTANGRTRNDCSRVKMPMHARLMAAGLNGFYLPVLWKKFYVAVALPRSESLGSCLEGFNARRECFWGAYLLDESAFSTENADYPQASRLHGGEGIDTLRKSQ